MCLHQKFLCELSAECFPSREVAQGTSWTLSLEQRKVKLKSLSNHKFLHNLVKFISLFNILVLPSGNILWQERCLCTQNIRVGMRRMSQISGSRNVIPFTFSIVFFSPFQILPAVKPSMPSSSSQYIKQGENKPLLQGSPSFTHPAEASSPVYKYIFLVSNYRVKRLSKERVPFH